MISNSKIAIIGSGKMACHFVDKADEMGIYTLCFAKEPGRINEHPVGKFYSIDIFDIEQITDICSREQVAGILPTTELTISVVGRIADALGLTSNSIELMDNVTKKQWVRDKVAASVSFRQPWYQHIKSHSWIHEEKYLEFPLIVKPVSEGGKRGISVVYNETELLEALDGAFKNDKHGNGVILEQFITEGREFSVEGLSYHGEHQIIQITDNISSGPPHCAELGHSQPADIDNILWKRIVRAVTELLTLVGFKNGGTHTEIKLYKDEIYLIELNARLGGDCIAYPLTELSTGYDYLKENIKVAMDISPEPKDHNMKMRYAGIRYVTKQSSELVDIFNQCDNKSWLYKKVKVSETLSERNGNAAESNYFIYLSDEKLNF